MTSRQQSSVSVQDLLSGNQLKNFKEGVICGQSCLVPLFDQYILCSQKDSSVIHLWSLKKPLHLKWKAPNKITSLTATPNGNFIIVAMSEKVQIYQTSSGKLCATLQRHFQPVTCIRMSKCGSFFLTGGEDGLVLMWLLFSILNNAAIGDGSNSNPKHTWSDHTGKITDMHCGSTGIRGKCCTISEDSTCKIYEILTGQLLASLTFDEPLWSVVMDPAQNYLFVGGEKGSIYETKLYDQTQILNDFTKPPSAMIQGHSSKVTHLCTSLDGLALVSGSHDGKVIIWHLKSRQPMKTFDHKGAITNLLVVPTPRAFYHDIVKFQPVKAFQSTTDPTINRFEKEVIYIVGEPKVENQVEEVCEIKKNGPDSNPTKARSDEESRTEELTKINSQLYSFIVDSIFKSSLSR